MDIAQGHLVGFDKVQDLEETNPRQEGINEAFLYDDEPKKVRKIRPQKLETPKAKFSIHWRGTAPVAIYAGRHVIER